MLCPVSGAAVLLLRQSLASTPAVLTTVAVRHLPARKKRIAYWPNDWLPFQWEHKDKPMGYFDTGSSLYLALPPTPLTLCLLPSGDPDEKLEKMLDLKNLYKPGFEFLKDRDE